MVIAKDIIEHLIDPARAMREFASVLKPGGKIYIECPLHRECHIFGMTTRTY